VAVFSFIPEHDLYSVITIWT